MNAERLWVGSAVVLLTLLSYFYFPGHTYLQSDTQIYVPILERLLNPSAYVGDIIAERPHVAFTIYDEVALLLRRLTGAGWEAILTAQQLVYRALGILGVLQLGTACGLTRATGLLVAALYAIGATITGPAVLTVEYEPVPRGFAVPLLLLGVGLLANDRPLLGSVAGGIAFLYHPPTALPFAAVLVPLALVTRKARILLPFAACAALLITLSLFQSVPERQPIFEKIGPELENLQRIRASYNWVSIWLGAWWLHYLFLWIFGLAAIWRPWPRIPRTLKWFLIGLPLTGVLSIPASWLLLEQAKWAFIPQAQPGRALLFVTAVAVIAGGAAGMHAGLQRRFWEAILWLIPVLGVAINNRVLQLFSADLSIPLIRKRALLVLVFATVVAAAAWLQRRNTAVAFSAWIVAVTALFIAIPAAGEVRNYPAIHTPEIYDLASWAKQDTPPSAVFLFADAGTDLAPGIFRVRSLRTVYVDWKGGGQINFLRSFADIWWKRWQETGAGKLQRERLPDLAALGIDYIVLERANALLDSTPVHENAKYVVYQLEGAAPR